MLWNQISIHPCSNFSPRNHFRLDISLLRTCCSRNCGFFPIQDSPSSKENSWFNHNKNSWGNNRLIKKLKMKSWRMSLGTLKSSNICMGIQKSTYMPSIVLNCAEAQERSEKALSIHLRLTLRLHINKKWRLWESWQLPDNRPSTNTGRHTGSRYLRKSLSKD